MTRKLYQTTLMVQQLLKRRQCICNGCMLSKMKLQKHLFIFFILNTPKKGAQSLSSHLFIFYPGILFFQFLLNFLTILSDFSKILSTFVKSVSIFDCFWNIFSYYTCSCLVAIFPVFWWSLQWFMVWVCLSIIVGILKHK